ncbi:MAG: serine/threonine protein kinase [Alphaproteobacteria bacterium]|nr:serine/threonine protein kinase [Alphaproteobacteria bacterium]MCB9699164.1 serine/threonine protein kinase [Alphaproteobacteria bacterium]
MSDHPHVLGGRWRLEVRIGRGAMGDVWRARSEEDGSRVAVKLLRGRLSSDPELVARFQREVDNGRRLDHPNAVRVLGGGRLEEGKPYLVMELLQGRKLSGWLAERGPLPPEVVADLGCQIAAGLAAAHRVGVIHRDLKPDNVMVSADEEGRLHAVVFDFGLSYGTVDDASRLTSAEVRIGSPSHMSPEYIEEGTIDAASDFYALGVVLYELACGHLPFDGPGHRVMTQKVRGEPPPLESRCDAPSWLCDAVHALLARDPARRPTSEEAVRALLTPPS